MKPTLTLCNEYRWLGRSGEFTAIYLNFDWCRGSFYCLTFRLLCVGFCVGCYADKPLDKVGDEYSADDTLPHVGPTVWEIKNQQDLHDALQEAAVQSQAAHPFQDPDALTGNVTTPAGAQDFQVAYDEKGGEAGWAVEPRNWVDQERDGS